MSLNIQQAIVCRTVMYNMEHIYRLHVDLMFYYKVTCIKINTKNAVANLCIDELMY